MGNHRSYYDIPILLTALDAPHGILAKEELEKIPLLNRWMKLLGCVFVKRDDIHGLRATPGDIRVRILPAIQTAGMSKAEQKQLPDAVRQTILAQL